VLFLSASASYVLTTFHVDHSALVYLVSKASLTGKLARWTLLLQEYEFDIVHRPRAQHAVADFLSRLESGEAPAGVADDFPDAEIMTATPKAAPRDDPNK
jgi:ABC-type sulfate transport system substrate-binding protein